MSIFTIDDLARTMLGGARNIADQTRPTSQQTESIINYLKSALLRRPLLDDAGSDSARG